jgi:hypothetical protein
LWRLIAVAEGVGDHFVTNGVLGNIEAPLTLLVEIGVRWTA